MRPTKAPDVDAFRRAIRKGLGRAILMLQRDGPNAYREQILGALKRWADELDRGQQLRMALQFAKQGHEDARQSIHDAFEGGIQIGKPCGEHEIIQLDGLKGLLHVLDHVGRLILERPTFRADSYLWMLDSEGMDEDAKRRSIQKAAESNERIKAYWDWFQKDEQGHSIRQSMRRPRDLTYPELKNWIETGVKPDTNAAFSYALWGWGRVASEEDIRVAARDLIAESRPEMLLCYLRIFDRRAFPLPHGRLLELARGGDPEIAVVSKRALANVQARDVRALALEFIGRGSLSHSTLELLAKNYEAGDAGLIEAALPASGDEGYLHDIGFGLLDLFEASQTPECRISMLWLYQNGPCETCRGCAVELLLKTNTAPDWLLEECRHDSDEHIREHVGSGQGCA